MSVLHVAHDRRIHFNVAEYGARSGDSGAAMASLVTAWERIRSAIKALPDGTTTEVYFPRGAWKCDTPLCVDWSNTTIRGEPSFTSLSVWSSMASIAMLVGLDRRPAGNPFPTNLRPWYWDNGPTDGTMGGYALRVGPGSGHHLAAVGTVADVGIAQWAGFQDEYGIRRAPPRKLTIEVAFAYHGTIPEGPQLCGIMDRYFAAAGERFFPGSVRPWSIWFAEPMRWYSTPATEPAVVLSVAATDGPEPDHEKAYLANATADAHEFLISLGSIAADTLIRLVVQVDLATATVTAYVGNTQVAVTPRHNGTAGTGWLPDPDAEHPKLHFVRNECWPFKVGADGRWPTASGSEPLSEARPLGVHGEFTVYGLAVSTDLRYRNDGAGQPILRIDTNAAPPSDFWRYQDDGSGSTAPALWWLELVQPAPTVRDGRIANLVHGRHTGTPGMRDTAFLCDSSGDRYQNNAYVARHDVAITDLTILTDTYNYTDTYGAAVVARSLLNFRMERVNLFGGWYGLQGLFADTMYPVYLADVQTQGNGAGIMLARAAAEVYRLHVGLPGLYGVLLFGGDMMIDGLRSSGWNGRIGHALVKRIPQEWGYNLSLRNVWDDNEGGYTPCEGLVVVERGDYTTTTFLTVDNMTIGVPGQGAPVFALRNRTDTGNVDGADSTGQVSIRGLACPGIGVPGIVGTDGPFWSGRVVAPAVWAKDEVNRGRTVVYTDRFNTGVATTNIVVGA